MEALTYHKLEETVREYFADYFTSMQFKPEDHPDGYGLAMKAMQYGRHFECFFDLLYWQDIFNAGFEYHALENLASGLKRKQGSFLLEHQKAAN